MRLFYNFDDELDDMEYEADWRNVKKALEDILSKKTKEELLEILLDLASSGDEVEEYFEDDLYDYFYDDAECEYRESKYWGI